jgi:hypothetical protein
MKMCDCGRESSDDALFCDACGLTLGLQPLSTEAHDRNSSEPQKFDKRTYHFEMGKRAALGLILGFCLLIVALVIGLEWHSSPTRVSNGSAGAFGSIQVVECPSSFGAGSVPPSQYPAQEATNLASTQANRLSYYSDSTRSVVPILAPKGWKCAFDEGADGSMYFSIYPRGQVLQSGQHSNSGSKAEGVNAQSTSVCQGCAADLVCPVFVNAKNDLGYTGETCPTVEPPEEKVRFLEGTSTGSYGIADIFDPPGVNGTNWGSGGLYPANGVLEFLPSQTGSTSAAESCVLPPLDKSLCSAIISNFITVQWWQ